MRISDWSSDVCASDLPAYWPKVNPAASAATRANATGADQAGFATSRCHAIGCLRVPAGTLAERMAIPYNLLISKESHHVRSRHDQPGPGHQDRKSVVEGKSV